MACATQTGPSDFGIGPQIRMATHVAILLRPYIRRILDGSKTVESRLTRTRRPPLDCVAAGDRIFFKASSGPFMATAIAAKVETHRDLTPAKINALRRKHNAKVGGDAEYWAGKRDCRYATFITLRDVRSVSVGPAPPPSRGAAWFVVPDPPDNLAPAGGFDLTLSRAAFTTRVLRVPRARHAFPADAYGQPKSPGQTIELLMPDGETIYTDLIAGDGRFRWRGWARYIRAHALQVCDQVRFEPLDSRRWRVTFIRNTRMSESDPDMTSRPTNSAPRLADYVSPAEVDRLIRIAREEDLGPRLDDITSRLFVPAALMTRAVMRSRKPGRLSGAALVPAIAKLYDPAIVATVKGVDGQALEAGSIVAEFRGPLRSILAMERVALNFVTHLSGIATLAERYVAATAGTKAGIYDTRKTIPGLRGLAKYAVVCGGGHSHRMGLHDAVLVKDNHVAHVPLEGLSAALASGIAQARAEKPRPAFIEIEVDTLAQLEKVLPLGPDLVLLDNMDLAQLRTAVALRDRVAPKVELEASGGVNLETVRAIAQTGVDRIAIGALTHSAPSLDLGLDIDAQG